MLLYLYLSSLDGLINSVYFLLLSDYNGLYSHNYFDRQIFYLMISIVYHLLMYTLYINVMINLIITIAIILTFPLINNYVLKIIQFSKLTIYILINIIAIILKYELKYISKSICGQKLKINYTDLCYCIKKQHIYQLFTNIVKIHLLLYIKSIYPSYYEIIKFIYGYNLISDTNNLVNIIQCKDWIKLLDMNVLYTIIKSYHDDQPIKLTKLLFTVLSIYSIFRFINLSLGYVCIVLYLGYFIYTHFKFFRKLFHNYFQILILALILTWIIISTSIDIFVSVIGIIWLLSHDNILCLSILYSFTLGILSGYDPIHCFINILIMLSSLNVYHKYNRTIIVPIDDYF